MKTIIFGGSFDPIHNGHIEVALKVKEYLKADKVIFMLAKHPRWKKNTTNDKQRLEMLRIALEDYPWAGIDLTEINSKDSVNYTYDSVSIVKKKYSGELYFLIGGDQLNLLDHWYKIDELIKIVKIVCVERPSFSLNKENIDKYHVQVIKQPVSDVSSTLIRNMSSLETPLKVIDYIFDNHLYFVQKYLKYFSLKRYNHSLSVAHLAYKIANANKVNPYKAFLSGLIHDIGKQQNGDCQTQYMKDNYPTLLNQINKELYHQFYSVKIAQDDFNINDQEIIDAIKYHATGNKNMSTLAKIIYAADKIDPLRGYDSSILIKNCIDDIRVGFKNVLKENIEYLKKNQKDYNNTLTNACINFYLGRGK